MYESETDVCDGIVRPDVDYVYASFRLGNQSTIAQLLNENVKSITTQTLTEYCMKEVFRVLCYFYLPPCGNSTHLAPPPSICHEECHTVQKECNTTWNTVFKNLHPILECSSTSMLLFPVPHCCTGAGLGLALDLPSSTVASSPEITPLPNESEGALTVASSPEITSLPKENEGASTVASSPETSSLPKENEGAMLQAVISVVVFLLLAVVATMIIVPLLVVVFSKRRRKKKLKNMQLDIMAM